MKKSILALLCALAFTIGTNSSNAQALGEGNFHLDVYAGYPNLLNNLFKSNEQLVDIDNQVEFTSIPTLGLRFGYMLADNISLGIDFNYSSFNFSYTDVNTSYDYNLGLNRIRAMARFEVHFSQNDQLDMYVPIAAGMHKLTPNVSTTDPNEQDLVDDIENVLGIFDFPVAFRVGFGGRYFFTDNIGLNLEIGLGGGSLIEGGLAIKF
jgi:opacity protein-like surface antigen